MDIKQMEYLVAAVESRSLSKAAKRLYTTQPNVSKVLKNLEEELSIDLLVRSPKGVTLTKKGQGIYNYALEIIDRSEAIRAMAQEKHQDMP